MDHPTARPTRPSPFDAPISRRRALAVIGTSVASVVLLDACGPVASPASGGWVPAEVDPATLTTNRPVLVGFAGRVGGSSLGGSAWLVRRSAGDLVAFDPRCTHAQCAYTWTDQARFACLCHAGYFGIDGRVISGPPPRPLDQLGVRETGGSIELEVPADFSTPRPAA